MNNNLSQSLIKDKDGRCYIKDDWHPAPLPVNLLMDEMAYPDTAYSYTTCFSKKPIGFHLGYASGNYGHSMFTTGINGQIIIGKYVILQSTRIISNCSIIIKDHCMFSWGSVITDSWSAALSVETRRGLLKEAFLSKNRHIEFANSAPVLIEENAWIGFEAIVLPGVRIGRGAVVGCKSVVYESVPDYAVVVGNPARIIKYLQPTDSIDVKNQAIRSFAKE